MHLPNRIPTIPQYNPATIVTDKLMNNSAQADQTSAYNPYEWLNISTTPRDVLIYICIHRRRSMFRLRMYSEPSHMDMNGSIKWKIEKNRRPAIKCLMIIISQNILIVFCLFPSATRFPTPAYVLSRIELNICPTFDIIIV